jgi:glycogen synthase
MHILAISNFYPPYYIGGYELGCHDVVSGLQSRGHRVSVLTSTYGVGHRTTTGQIYRWLHHLTYPIDPIHQIHRAPRVRRHILHLTMLKRDIINRVAFRHLYHILNPDILYVWNMGYLPISLVLAAQQWATPIAFFIFDDWLAHYQDDYWYTFWGHRLVHGSLWRHIARTIALPSPFSGLDLRHAQFATEYLKRLSLQSGQPVHNAAVIHWGVDAARYSPKRHSNPQPRLLYVGRLHPSKGAHTAIEALGRIVQQPEHRSVTLTIVGAPDFDDYYTYLKQLVSLTGLKNNVIFHGFASREEMPSVYRAHDILIFPSVWEEPFGIILLEAMASGLAVVGTGTGGSAEILQDGYNALVFRKEDPDECAAQILRLLQEPRLREAVGLNGRRSIEIGFTIERTIDQIERALQEAM